MLLIYILQLNPDKIKKMSQTSYDDKSNVRIHSCQQIVTRQWASLILRCFYVVRIEYRRHLDITMKSSHELALVDFSRCENTAESPIHKCAMSACIWYDHLQTCNLLKFMRAILLVCMHCQYHPM